MPYGELCLKWNEWFACRKINKIKKIDVFFKSTAIIV